MKKRIVSVILVAVALLTFSACSQAAKTETRFMLNTTVSVSAYDGTDEDIEGMFSLCAKYEGILSRTDKNSEIYKLNKSGKLTVSDTAKELIASGIEYYYLSGKRFDITLGKVSSLWDFTGDTLPDGDSIKSALPYVGAEKVKIENNTVDTGGTEIDLGAIAKGYIADKAKDYLVKRGVKNAVLNFGGNISVIGKQTTIGIRRPFSTDEIIAEVSAKNTSVVTSGVYERYIKKDGKIYHHILDPKTGYAVDTDLLSATVICPDSTKADALSTVCILAGKQKAKDIIESTKDAQAIFIDRDYKLTATDGLIKSDGKYKLK